MNTKSSTWSFYDPKTGLFTGRVFTGSERLLGINSGGEPSVEGRYDHRSERVDLETGEVVDYQPPRPGEDHEWDSGTKRWVLSPKAVRRKEIVAEIRQIEKNEQPRALREAVLGMGDGYLRKIEERITKLRAELTEN